jgi:uncharacterized protein YndB with AHSA1/START domain
MPTITDRIQKQVLLRAPLARVWRAVSDSREFGSWFGVEFDGAFSPNTQIRGKIVPTKADSEVAKKQKPHEGMAFELTLDRIEPPRLLSFRWHPFAVEPGVEYTNEPATLVVFELAEQDGGTRLTITESGFDQIPLARRATAFAKNEQGWTIQTELIAKYLAHET